MEIFRIRQGSLMSTSGKTCLNDQWPVCESVWTYSALSIPLLYLFCPQVSAEGTPGKLILGLEVSRKPLLETRASSGIVSLFPHLFSHGVIFSQSMKKVAREGRRKSHERATNQNGKLSGNLPKRGRETWIRWWKSLHYGALQRKLETEEEGDR